jgi:hypothetical protein
MRLHVTNRRETTLISDWVCNNAITRIVKTLYGRLQQS